MARQARASPEGQPYPEGSQPGPGRLHERGRSSIHSSWECCDVCVTPHGLEHLHLAPGPLQNPIMYRPASSPHGRLTAWLAERRAAVELHGKRSPRRKAPLGLVHQLPSEEIPAAVSLVNNSRMIEERLDQKEIHAEQPAELFHALEHAPEQTETAPDLPWREPGLERAQLLREIPADTAEERVLPILGSVDPAPLASL